MKHKSWLIFLTTALALITLVGIPIANSLIVPPIQPGTYQYDSNDSACKGITGTYFTMGNNITVFVCNASIFTAWSASPAGAPGGALWSKVDSTTGEFDLSWSDSGTYYVVLSNIEGINPVYITFAFPWKPEGIPGFEISWILIGLLSLLIIHTLTKKKSLNSI